MLDYAVLDIGGTIRRWNTELPVLRQAIDRLSLMLDEWPALMKMARDALRGTTDEMIDQLRVLRSMLPRVPDADPSSGIVRRTAMPDRRPSPRFLVQDYQRSGRCFVPLAAVGH